MNPFNHHRFVQYARYDLTINRAFYRNMAIVTAAITVGLAILSFLFRWIGIRNIPEGMEENFADRYTVTGATYFITAFLGLMCLVYAGCIHHPLRTKQSRISVLTLPATNAEKFLWHTALVIVGGYLLGIACVLFSDGVNALLSLLAGIPAEKIYSITAEHFRYYTLSMNLPMVGEMGFNPANTFNSEIYTHLILLSTFSGIWAVSAYAFGNAVKYRYNIVWTILALQALQFVLTVLGIILVIISGEMVVDRALDTDPTVAVRTLSIFSLVILIGTTILMWWGSWKLYKKAQITSKLNR